MALNVKTKILIINYNFHIVHFVIVCCRYFPFQTSEEFAALLRVFFDAILSGESFLISKDFLDVGLLEKFSLSLLAFAVGWLTLNNPETSE